MQIMITIPDPKDQQEKNAIMDFLRDNIQRWANMVGHPEFRILQNALIQEVVKGGAVSSKKTM